MAVLQLSNLKAEGDSVFRIINGVTFSGKNHELRKYNSPT